MLPPRAERSHFSGETTFQTFRAETDTAREWRFAGETNEDERTAIVSGEETGWRKGTRVRHLLRLGSAGEDAPAIKKKSRFVFLSGEKTEKISGEHKGFDFLGRIQKNGL